MWESGEPATACLGLMICCCCPRSEGVGGCDPGRGGREDNLIGDDSVD